MKGKIGTGMQYEGVSTASGLVQRIATTEAAKQSVNKKTNRREQKREVTVSVKRNNTRLFDDYTVKIIRSLHEYYDWTTTMLAKEFCSKLDSMRNITQYKNYAYIIPDKEIGLTYLESKNPSTNKDQY